MVIELGCVFDVDDTLYLERDYVHSGFTAVALYASARLCDGTDGAATDFLNSMWHGFRADKRGSTFDDLLDAFPELRHSVSVPELIDVYRRHTPTIALDDNMGSILIELRQSGCGVAVISDGAYECQTAKVEALGLRHLADPIVLTGAWGREWWKPHRRAFEKVAQNLSLPAHRLVYVGDNPAKDFLAPLAMGWHAIRLRLPGQLHENAETRDSRVIEVSSHVNLSQAIFRLVTSVDRRTREKLHHE